MVPIYITKLQIWIMEHQELTGAYYSLHISLCSWKYFPCPTFFQIFFWNFVQVVLKKKKKTPITSIKLHFYGAKLFCGRLQKKTVSSNAIAFLWKRWPSHKILTFQSACLRLLYKLDIESIEFWVIFVNFVKRNQIFIQVYTVFSCFFWLYTFFLDEILCFVWYTQCEEWNSHHKWHRQIELHLFWWQTQCKRSWLVKNKKKTSVEKTVEKTDTLFQVHLLATFAKKGIQTRKKKYAIKRIGETNEIIQKKKTKCINLTGRKVKKNIANLNKIFISF